MPITASFSSFWRVSLIAPVILLAGFQRTDDVENARFKSFNGLTVEQFIDGTLHLPQDAYDDRDGRNFIIVEGNCTVILRTTYTGDGKEKGPRLWRIRGTSRRGWCGAF
jgi:hypothetical protein